MNSEKILALWAKMGSNALTRAMFSKMFSWSIPYTGTIGAEIVALSPGKAHIEMKDRRAFRNHLGSIHAVALANLGEFSTGLALTVSLPADARIIIKSLEISYLKKARGTLQARATTPVQSRVETRSEVWVQSQIFDRDQNIVSEVKACWVVGPKKNDSVKKADGTKK